MSRRHKAQGAPMSFFSFQDIIACTTGIMLLTTMMLALELVSQPPAQPLPSSSDLSKSITESQATLDMLQKMIESNRRKLNLPRTAQQITPAMVEEKRRKVGDLIDQNTRMKGEAGRLQRDLQVASIEQQSLAMANRELVKTAEEEEKKTRITWRSKRGSGKEPYVVECGTSEIVVCRVLPSRETKEVARFSGGDPVQAFVNWAAKRNPSSEYFVLLVRPDAVKNYEKLHGTLEKSGFSLGWDLWPPDKKLVGS